MTTAVDEYGASDSSLWNRIKVVAEEFGVELFDIDTPSASSPGGVLRVYLSRPKQSGGSTAQESGEEGGEERRTGVSFEDCVRVTKQLLDLDEIEGFIPDGCMLEVSSPGINRRLRLPQHFTGAVGERVRVKFRAENNVYRVVTGLLTETHGDTLIVNDEQGKEPVRIPLSTIKEARVDFKF